MNYLDKQLKMLKEAINNGTLSKDDNNLSEQKNLIIDRIIKLHRSMGVKVNSTQVELIVNKKFEEELDI